MVQIGCSLAFALVALMHASAPAWAEVRTQEIVYKVGDAEFTGYLAYDDEIDGKRPGVLVVHEWWGHNPYVRRRAEMLAELGYTAFALDMYGSGKLADHPDNARAFMQALMADLPGAEARFTAAKALLQQHDTVEAENIAALGYCMGGALVLHMARTGADLAGVVSYHGGLGTRTPAEPGRVKAKVVVFTGAADPLVPADQVQAFVGEMLAGAVDMELKAYPGVTHSFTNPDADEFGKRFGMPLAYDEAADADSWGRTQAFLEGLFTGANE